VTAREDLRVTVMPTTGAAATAAAVDISVRARAAVADHGRFTLALSGGRTPGLMLAALGELDMPWSQTTIFQVDERICPRGHPERNLTGLRAALGPANPATVVEMPVEAEDLAGACGEYAMRLPSVLDLVHLGLGADGHTASLVPGDAVLQVRDADVALTGSYQGRRRMTLTAPRITRARAILWLVTGVSKRPALRALLAGDRKIPAGLVHGPPQSVFCDAAALGGPSGTGR
jgi:6-phosphogluconolactonase